VGTPHQLRPDSKTYPYEDREGIPQLRQERAASQAMGAEVGQSAFLALLAEALDLVHKTGSVSTRRSCVD
jgi:hypothetical protein